MARKLLLLAFILVGLSATAGSFAFAWWAWPRLPDPLAPGAGTTERLADIGILSLLALHGFCFQAYRPVRWLHARLHGCEQALAAFLKGLLLVLLAALWEPWGQPGITQSGVILWLARAAFLLGILLHLSAAAAVGNDALLGYDGLRRRLEGRPPTKVPGIYAPTLTGPFARIRHPFTLASIICLACGAPFSGERLLVAAGAAAWLLACAWARERTIARLGGEAYDRYRRRTGFILPRRPASTAR
jgi:hypothetical protein